MKSSSTVACPLAGTGASPAEPRPGGDALRKQLRLLNGVQLPCCRQFERASHPIRHDVDSDLKTWFASAILPHQAALTRYLRRVCKSSSDVPDLLQEALVRVYVSATKSRPRFPKTFLFTTARNLLIDKLRRERVVAIVYTPKTISLDRPVDELSPERRLGSLQDLQQLTRAFDSLPEKTRSVIWLRRIAGLSQRETAAILGIGESALEAHMTRGLRSLARALAVDGRGDKNSPGEIEP